MRYTIHHVPEMGEAESAVADVTIPTSHASRKSSSLSIISFNMGSCMSQSWKAAVSLVRVTPSNICDLLAKRSNVRYQPVISKKKC